MERLTVGSVVRVRFPFSDLSSKKYRPALIVAQAEFDDIIVCQITSNSYGKKNIVPITEKDFSSGSLPVNSFARPDKLFTLSSQLVTRGLGKISDKKMVEVRHGLARLLGLA